MAQLAIRYHRVEVTIDEQVAVTHVDQVFFNPNDYPVEGVYVLPLPPDAAVSSFTLWIDGKPVQGEVLDAETARGTYEEIVRSMRDPALLEYAGRGAMRASIFPIPPQGERRIELEYTQALPAENGLVRYIYPLSTEKFSVWPLENVTVRVQVRSDLPIRAVYSPSHPVAVSREGPNEVVAGYEATNVLPDADFALYYSLGEEQAFHLIPYQDPNDAQDPDGFFMLLLAPRPDAAEQTLPKDVLLVLDRSGSMEGEKFLQAQEALRYILRHLNPEDRFNLIAFSTGLETYGRSLRPADEANEALAWVDRLSAEGSTDIHRALLEAAALLEEAGGGEGNRPAYVIFLTDGLPTEGVVDSQQILDGFGAVAPQDLRLFSFGVGYDVDTFLLDSLAQAHHGASSYVLPGERLDEALSSFYAKISTPVLTDLELDFGDLAVYDLYPSPLPDLFLGSQIVVVGRFREGGETDVTLTGKVNGQTQTFRYPDQRFSGGTGQQSAIPRLWATRKIGHLLNQVRLNGANQELIDQIVRLSIRYGIVTPYTSYLVTEPQPLGAAEQERIAGEQFRALQATGTAPASGQKAVEESADQSALAGAAAPSGPDEGASSTVKVVGARTFVLNEEVWTDTGYDPDRMETVKVPFLSEDYFSLAAYSPDLAAALALGERVIVLWGGEAYEVVEAGEQAPPVKIPTSEPGSAATTTQDHSNPPGPTGDAPPLPGGEDTPEVLPVASGEQQAPGSLNCAVGLLALVPAAVFLLRRKAKNY
jgi:Ca-activated chloride channel family protein